MEGSGESQNDMSLRRGFVKVANEIALSVRTELDLDASAPLSPWLVAEHLNIPVVGMSSLIDDAPSAVRHFSQRSLSEFSGVTVFDGQSRIIVHNDSHSPGRQANDVSHENSHALLLHEPGPALDALGCRVWDGIIEQEAAYLGGALLVPQEATKFIACRRLTMQAAAFEYGVSAKLMTYRMRITAANLRVARGERVRH